MANLRLARRSGADVTEIDMQMMERAIRRAREAAAIGEVPVGAVVYRGSEVIAEAANTREATRDPVGHAELIAIRDAAARLGEWRLSDCSLAVTLEPCPMCAGAIVNARVGRVLYGATDPKAGACETLYRITNDVRLNHRPVMYGGVLGERCGELLRDFFRRLRSERKKSA
ncbi:MAG: nucleoside deaminase [Phycisphaerales bacterium]